MEGDGNGWAAGPGGKKMWGLYGAAGLFLYAAKTDTVLMQHRALWTASGGKWALPGGARDSHETAAQAALREAVEETALDPQAVRIVDELVTAGPFEPDPARPELAGDWTYTTVLARTTRGEELDVQHNSEAIELRWVRLENIPELELVSAFAASLPFVEKRLREQLG